jgi:hypothetical protein
MVRSGLNFRDLPVDEQDRILSGILDSVRRVGPDKPVGYLPLYTIRDVLGLQVDVLSTEAQAEGLSALRLDPEECCIESGVLYVFDGERLAALLASEAETLASRGWPAEPEGFVRALAAEWVEPDDPVLPIIRRAFGHPPPLR